MFRRILKFFKIAIVSLFENKTKTLLTMLGIVIGIAAVIVVLSIGKGAEKLILFSVDSFGSRSVFVQPGGGESGGPPQPQSIDRLKYNDYLALKKLDFLEDLSPILVYNGTISWLSIGQRALIVGSNENYVRALNTGVSLGRGIDQSDIDFENRVILLGYKVADSLFADQNPIGKKVKLSGKDFQVIGILEKQGTRFFQDFDKRVVIPITTMRKHIFGPDYVLSILANVKDGYDIQESIDEIRLLIRKRHSIFNPEDNPNLDDFKVISQVDAARTFQGISDVLTYFLTLVAGISLLVGGIGIMNVMFVSVSERTREIGLRKAVGASKGDILLQFLVESIVLTFFAGMLGVFSGIGISFLLSEIIKKYYDSWSFFITAESLILAFSVATFIGIFFGLYPAWQASKLDPIEALKQE